MPFTDWDSYTDLLGKLAEAAPQWRTASDFEQFDVMVRQNCPELIAGTAGYDALQVRMAETGGYDDPGLLFEDLRTAILAHSGAQGTAGEIPAQQTPQDLTQQHFDPESGRWRRWHDSDNEFEYYHNDDSMWERVRNGSWHRFHTDTGQWLPFDAPSGTWLYQNTWLPYDKVTAPRADDEAELTAFAERMVAETIAELGEDFEPLSAEELAEAVAMVRQNLREG